MTNIGESQINPVFSENKGGVMTKLANTFITTVRCAEDSGKGTTYLKRASQETLQDIFNKYASVEQLGERYITADDFICKFLGLYTHENANKSSIKLLAGVLDTSKDGLVSFPEFASFEGILCSPDALYKTAFQLFDTQGTGTVGFEEFRDLIKHTELHSQIPFDFTSNFCKMYFGSGLQRKICYNEFSQFLHDFHEEHAHQAFQACMGKAGTISGKDFAQIMTATRCHLLTGPVKENLIAVTKQYQISYPFFRAFNYLLTDMELVKRVYLSSTGGSRTQELTKEAFLHTAQMMSQITPMEVDILYSLTELISQNGGRLFYADLEAMTPEQSLKVITRKLMDYRAVESPAERGSLRAV